MFGLVDLRALPHKRLGRAATSSMKSSTCLGLHNLWNCTPGASFWMASRSGVRYRVRYAKSHRQKSECSRDRRTARHAHSSNGRSRKTIVSAARSRISITSYGPKSPSMIQDSSATSFRRISAHCSGGVGTRPDCQNSLSSSITGIPVISPRRFPRVDFPEAPGPSIRTRFILFRLHSILKVSVCRRRRTFSGKRKFRV